MIPGGVPMAAQTRVRRRQRSLRGPIRRRVRDSVEWFGGASVTSRPGNDRRLTNPRPATQSHAPTTAPRSSRSTADGNTARDAGSDAPAEPRRRPRTTPPRRHRTRIHPGPGSAVRSKGWPALFGRSAVATHIGDPSRAAGFLPIAMPPSLRHHEVSGRPRSTSKRASGRTSEGDRARTLGRGPGPARPCFADELRRSAWRSRSVRARRHGVSGVHPCYAPGGRPVRRDEWARAVGGLRGRLVNGVEHTVTVTALTSHPTSKGRRRKPRRRRRARRRSGGPDRPRPAARRRGRPRRAAGVRRVPASANRATGASGPATSRLAALFDPRHGFAAGRAGRRPAPRPPTPADARQARSSRHAVAPPATADRP